MIKSFSDNITNSSIVLVGIADDIESLIGNHQSLERCLKQIKMPRMSKKECEEIIDNGLNELDIKISPKIKDKIIEFASGFPHYVHLLCKFGAKEIIENNKFEFSQGYLNIAIKKGIENTNEQLKSSFRKGVVGTQKWQDVTCKTWILGMMATNPNPMTKESAQNNCWLIALSIILLYILFVQ